MIPDTTPILCDVITDVDSSFISSVAYSHTDSEMTVSFHSGSEYTFPNVDVFIYDDIVNADSVGSAFNAFKGGL